MIARRHGVWFDELLAYAGSDTPDGPMAASQVIAARRDKAPVHIDVIGVGSSPYDFLVQNDVQAVGVNSSEPTEERTKDDTLGFHNVRALLWWRFREALDPLNPEPIALPEDPKLKADLCAPRFKVGLRGILIESKDEVKKRIGRSPDRADAVVLANKTTMKRGAKPSRLEMPSMGIF